MVEQARQRPMLGQGSAPMSSGSQMTHAEPPPFQSRGHRMALDDKPPQQSVRPLQSVPLNDMGVMPGNSRVDHTWRPSQDADHRARCALPAPGPTAPRAAEGGGN